MCAAFQCFYISSPFHVYVTVSLYLFQNCPAIIFSWTDKHVFICPFQSVTGKNNVFQCHQPRESLQTSFCVRGKSMRL